MIPLFGTRRLCRRNHERRAASKGAGACGQPRSRSTSPCRRRSEESSQQRVPRDACRAESALDLGRAATISVFEPATAVPVPAVTWAPAPPVTYAAHVRGLTYAAAVPTAATTTIPTPMIVDGSPPVRRRAAAGVASTCLLPSTEVRTGARSDSLAILVATFLPDTCSCVAVERLLGPLLVSGVAPSRVPAVVWLRWGHRLPDGPALRASLVVGTSLPKLRARHAHAVLRVRSSVPGRFDPVGSRQQSRQDQFDAW